jgi:RimJ/RimL family protein N-acetyltransferase
VTSASELRIETPRLLLRPLRAEDLDAFAAYRADPAIARYQGWESGFTRADAERLLAGNEEVTFGAPGKWLQLAAVDRRDGTLAGDCAVHVQIDQPATAEVGVTFAPASHGRGLATEALGAVVGALFEEQRMHRVVARADDRNAPVHRVLDRLGFRLEARFVEADWFKGEWTTLRVYAQLEREWRAQRGH